MKKIITITVLAAIAGLLFYFSLKNRQELPIQKKSRFLMDTYCSIQIPGDNAVLACIDKAFDRVEEIDKKFNIHNPESQIYSFNKNNTPITDPEIVKLIETSLLWCERSKGTFDITITPLVRLWGFYGPVPKNPRVPEKSEILKALEHVGYRKVIIKNGKVTKTDPAVEIDLGGVAKGYAVGQARDILKQLKITSAIIDLGGAIYALGLNNGKPWKAGIKNPRGDGIFGAFDATEISVGTSGDYERYFEKDGIRYCHILDPRTGYPARGLISVSIFTPDTVLADILSKPVFILGREEGLKFIENVQGTEALIISEDGGVSLTPGLKSKLSKKQY